MHQKPLINASFSNTYGHSPFLRTRMLWFKEPRHADTKVLPGLQETNKETDRAKARLMRAAFSEGVVAGAWRVSPPWKKKSDRKSLIFFPLTHFSPQSDGWCGETGSSNPGPCPPPHCSGHPHWTCLSLAVSLSLSPSLFLLLIYVFAEQLLPRELREQHSHLSTLVTRCHLLLPAHRTSEQTMRRAFWTSDLQCVLWRGLGGWWPQSNVNSDT